MCGICLSVRQHVGRRRQKGQATVSYEEGGDTSCKDSMCVSSRPCSLARQMRANNCRGIFSCGQHTKTVNDNAAYVPRKNGTECLYKHINVYERTLCACAGNMRIVPFTPLSPPDVVFVKPSQCDEVAQLLCASEDPILMRGVLQESTGPFCTSIADQGCVSELCLVDADIGDRKCVDAVASMSVLADCRLSHSVAQELCPYGNSRSVCALNYSSTSCPAFGRMIDNIARRGPDTVDVVSRCYGRDECCTAELCNLRECALSCSSASEIHAVGVSHDVGISDGKMCYETTQRAGLVDMCAGGAGEFSVLSTSVQGLASVLGLRGRVPVCQPYVIDSGGLASADLGGEAHVNDVDKCAVGGRGEMVSGNVKVDRCRSTRPTCAIDASFLMWNGEIFNGSLCPPPWGSDTIILAAELARMEQLCLSCGSPLPPLRDEVGRGLSAVECCSDTDCLRARQERFLSLCVDVFENQVEGPFGFVYYAAALRVTVFGRDPLGRHSLVTHVAAFRSHAQTALDDDCESQFDEFDVEFIVSSVGVRHRSYTELSVGSEETMAADVASSKAATAVCAKGSTDDACLAGVGNDVRCFGRGWRIKRPRMCDEGRKDVSSSRNRYRNEILRNKSSSIDPISNEDIKTTLANGNPNFGTIRHHVSGMQEGNGIGVMSTLEFTASSAPDCKGKSHACTSIAADHSVPSRRAAAHEDEDEDGEDGEANEDTCWEEVPVTGLFAIPFNQSLLTCDGAQGDYHDSVLVPPELSGKAAWMHCPWRRETHRIHPLLRRRGVKGCENILDKGPESALVPSGHRRHPGVFSDSGHSGNFNQDHVSRKSCLHETQHQSCAEDRVPVPQLPRQEGDMHRKVTRLNDTSVTPHNTSWNCVSNKATCTAVPDLLSMSDLSAQAPAPPPMSTLVAPAALPQVVLQHIASYGRQRLASRESMWAHWAAVRYLYALAEALARRIDFTRSGADDDLDSVKLFHARSRPVCILFSGGIDSTVLAALAHYLLPAETPIELVNVAFGEHPEHAPDRIAAMRAMQELLLLPQPYDCTESAAVTTATTAEANYAVAHGASIESSSTNKSLFVEGSRFRATRTPAVVTRRWEREWRLIFVDVPEKYAAHTPHVLDLITPRDTVMDLDIGTALWCAAQGQGRMQVLRRSDVVTGVGEDGQQASMVVPCHGILPGNDRDYDHKKDNSNDGTICTVPLGSDEVNASAEVGGLAGFCKHFRVHALDECAAVHRNNIRHNHNPNHISPPLSNASLSSTATAAVPAHSLSPSCMVAKRRLLSERLGTATEQTTPSSETIQEQFGVLIEVLVMEGKQCGGPDAPVLLSTLGKEYGSFLQPHIAAWGYKKLGSYLNDATRAGVIVFASDAPSKAVHLVRSPDRARATAVPPSRWLPTRYVGSSSVENEPTMASGELAAKGHSASASNHSGNITTDSVNCAGTAHPSLLECYKSEAKVILLGMGADETLGGYTRYRRFFRRHGMFGAREELQKDFARLWQRNLGRDDRITMDSGREPRFPFLDEKLLRTLEDIVATRHDCLEHMRESAAAAATVGQMRGGMFASHTHQDDNCNSSSIVRRSNVYDDTDKDGDKGNDTNKSIMNVDEETSLQWCMEPVVSFEMNPGEGDKRILRNVATLLGLRTVARLQKRAIQFGSRIADRKVRGTTTLRAALGHMA